MPETIRKPITTEAVFHLPFPPAAVWSVFSKTDWLNRAAGMPPINYAITREASGEVRTMARARFFGVAVEWEEKPFEWVEPEFYRVERVFAGRSPLERIVGGMEFQPEGEGAGTRLRIAAAFHPRNALGSWMARFGLARQATSGMEGLVRHAAEFLRGAKQTVFPKLERKPLNEAALQQGLRKLREQAREGGLEAKLEELLRESPDVELSRIRPLAVARKWGAAPWAVLGLFLRGTRAGLLDLSWEVLCPNCRSSRQQVVRTLTGLAKRAHCEACQITYDAEFDKSVELKFTLNPGLKACNEETFCLAGPGAKPHVLAQLRLAPGARAELRLPERGAALRLRSPQLKGMLTGSELEQGGAVSCGTAGFTFAAEGGGERRLALANDEPREITVALERLQWSEDILTAARVANTQEFRDLFAREVISPEEQIVVGQQVILFTDLRGSTAMYHGIGDAPAYALVRDHFAILREAIAAHRGGIVKTIGDAVMAAFSDPAESLEAVKQMHEALAAAPSRPGRPRLLLKSSLHLGPCLAVNANDHLDYFGTTVNLAARLVDRCQGGDLVVSADFFERPEAGEFLRRHGLAAEGAETQFRGFTAPTKLWRIPLLPAR